MFRRKENEQHKFVSSGNLEDVEYVQGGVGPTAGYGLFIKGRWVMKRTFETAWLRAIVFVPLMAPGAQFLTKQMWEPGAWEQFETGERHHLGLALRFFADQGMLPLCVVNPHASGTKIFERT